MVPSQPPVGNAISIGLIIDKINCSVCLSYAPQSEKPDAAKVRLYEEMARGWNMANAYEFSWGLGDFNGHVGKCAEGSEGIHGGYEMEKKKR